MVGTSHLSLKESSDYTYIPYTKYVTPCSHVCRNVGKIPCIMLLLMSFHVVYHCPLHCCSNFIFLFANPVVKLQEEFQYLKLGEEKEKE